MSSRSRSSSIELDCGAEEQVDFAQHAIMQLDRHRDQRPESGAPAMIERRRTRFEANRNHADRGLRARLAAVAVAGFETGSGLDQFVRQAVGGQHQVALVAFVGPAHAPTASACATAAHLTREAARQLVEGGGAR